ncbi:MAG: hypothetical protein F6K10_38995 [Moorea sp. SIO2B7]|nr:hypothetical protein [Moorena sp. SIO2B7]
MNFKQFIDTLSKKINEMESLEKFDIKYRIYPPSFLEDIKEMETEISEEEGMENFQVWNIFKDFYLVTGGFYIGWRYAEYPEGNPDTDKITTGATDIPVIYSIYDPEDEIGQPFKQLYEKYRLFDRISEDSQVFLKFDRAQQEPKLYYYNRDYGDKYYLMSIGFVEYMEILIQVMGLYTWQEFFIQDSSFIIDNIQRKRFLLGLETFFPNVNISNFQID